LGEFFLVGWGFRLDRDRDDAYRAFIGWILPPMPFLEILQATYLVPTFRADGRKQEVEVWALFRQSRPHRANPQH
jgi:hypothetical protein